MFDGYTEVSITTLKGGALVEIGNLELQKILANIADPNTGATVTRELNLKVKIKPSEDRRQGLVEITSSVKLASLVKETTRLFLVSKGQQMMAFEDNPEQYKLPMAPLQVVGNQGKEAGNQ